MPEVQVEGSPASSSSVKVEKCFYASKFMIAIGRFTARPALHRVFEFGVRGEDQAQA
ncbi:hypothetical protein [Glutamicibacter ardleyensis]|uniref:hypothetical protein n=1 Tax=Glutamicibacter ardleyensis TaxID=225894 RepID=UPI003FD0D69C